jgi:hypothetical protein
MEWIEPTRPDCPIGLSFSEGDMKKTLPIEVIEFFKKQGAKGGKAGAKRRMEALTPERRSEIAKKAASARWKKEKPKKKE